MGRDINDYIELCLNSNFPYTVLTDASLHRNFNYLKSAENLSPQSNTCMQLIQHFHPSLWQANKKGHLSPFIGWNDVECLYSAIENRLKYKGSDLSPKDIRAGLTFSHAAPKVSIFKPALAKYIINKYLSDYTQIFDPCSGYSGRLLGAIAADKFYIGQDINQTTISESISLCDYFHITNYELYCKNSLATKGNYECLFTCPPYYDKENWNQDIEQLTCDEWIEACLNNYECEKYVFVVDKTENYKEFVIEKLQNKSHFGVSYEHVIII